MWDINTTPKEGRVINALTIFTGHTSVVEVTITYVARDDYVVWLNSEICFLSESLIGNDAMLN